jgi:phenylacetate-CoA ligase
MKLELLQILKAISSPEALKAYFSIKNAEKLSSEELIRNRDKNFSNMVLYCYENVPYYHNFMKLKGFIPSDFSKVEHIENFPILTKEIARKFSKDLISQKIDGIKHIERRSGGTTGEPISSLISREAANYEVFTYFKGLEIMGWERDMEMVKIFGGSLGVKTDTGLSTKLLDAATNSVYIPAFDISKDKIDSVFDQIMNLKQPVLIGYASSIFNLAICAQYSKKYSRELLAKKVKLAITTSELLPDSWKQTIESVFKCKVQSYYGCGEVNGIGYQMSVSSDYFVFDEHVIVESVIGSNNENELLLTQLFNKAKPLIRYKNGDLGRVSFINGRTKITELIGRTADMLVKEDGTRISSIFGTHSVFMSKVQVEKYQYIQTGINNFEFIYNPVNSDITDSEKETLKIMLAKVMDCENITLKFVKNGEFEISSNGKHRIIINKIN